jgi:hypothetical protein
MWRTLVHQTYTGNVAIDSSGNCNHGVPIQVTPDFPGFSFDQQGSRISIQPSATLEDLGNVRAVVRFALEPSGTPHRWDLAEGYLSFALFIDADFSLQGTILDQNSQWTGVATSANAVSTGVEHTAQVVCDGINSVQVLLDGNVVAESYDTVGQVRPVGQLGVAVGHWPDPPGVYTFEGTIYEFALQKYDPDSDLTAILDPCCADWSALAAFVEQLGREGISQAQLAEAGATLRAAGLASELALRGNSKSGTLAQRALARAAWLALARRDSRVLEKTLKAWKASASAVDSSTLASITQQFEQAFNAFGLSEAQWHELLRILCLNPEHLDREKKKRYGGHR